MTKLEWVTNTPKNPAEALLSRGETRHDHIRWRRLFVEGEPQATDACTSEQLREMGMVGLYRERRDD